MSQSDNRAPAPLAGVTVIELGTMITAPLAGMMLADLGAELVKVERPDGGDPFRAFRGGHDSPHFVAFNRNKRSVALDLQSESGRDALGTLLAQADVLIENFRPGVMDRLGFGAETLRARFPRLITCSITGFGEAGPYRDRPAFDTVGQALSGIAGLAIDAAAPQMVGTTISDNVTGMYACYGILAALYERHATGEGRRVTVNMLEASVAFMPDAFLNLAMLGVRNDPFTRVSFSQSFAVRCGDGRLLALHLSSPDKFWTGLCAAMERDELRADPRFESRAARIANYRTLAALLNEIFGARPRREWEERLAAADVPFAPIHTTADVLADPQIAALETFKDLPLADGKVVAAPQAPIRFDGKRLSAWRPAPRHGQHTTEILGGNKRN